MDKKKIELAVTVILVVLFLSLLSNTFKKTSKRSKPEAPAQIKKVAEKKTITMKAEMAAGEKLSQEKAKLLYWGRDPFVLVQRGELFETAATSLVLVGIVWERNKPAKALINNEIYKVGDRVGDIEILEIRKNSVVIKEGETTKEITLD